MSIRESLESIVLFQGVSRNVDQQRSVCRHEWKVSPLFAFLVSAIVVTNLEEPTLFGNLLVLVPFAPSVVPSTTSPRVKVSLSFLARTKGHGLPF